MWIFGYGSLTWKVDFPYQQRIVGYIKGYARRFWQASIDHRGVPGKPGRVVTLVPSEDPEEKVWGAAYEIPPDKESDVMDRLNIREQRFTNRKSLTMYSPSGQKLSESVLVFLGSKQSEFLLEDAPILTMAKQIAESHGPSGTNSEYLLRLANFMREEVPQARDDHLFQLEEEKVWGVAYKISEEKQEEVMAHLDHREKDGYQRTPVTFFPQETSLKPWELIIYLGSETNPFYTGPTKEDDIAQIIASAVGPSGSNKEYLFQLAQTMRSLNINDNHLYSIESKVKSLSEDSNQRTSN